MHATTFTFFILQILNIVDVQITLLHNHHRKKVIKYVSILRILQTTYSSHLDQKFVISL